MGISYKDALKAKKMVREKLFSDPNVVSVGVVAETNELGEPTGDYAVQIGVISIENYVRAQKCGQSAIPTEFLLPSEEQAEEKHVHFHVIKEGKIEALANPPKAEKDDIPSAIDDLPEIAKSANSYTLRRRPSPCGQSIGHPDVSAGTLGLLVEYTEGPNLGKAYVLSNNHVIAANNSASVGDPIIQPGNHDSGIVGRDTIAFLHRWVPLSISAFNYVDCAVAEVKGGTDWLSYVSPYITHVGIPGNPVDPRDTMFVEKVGRTTGRTQGEIMSSNIDIRIEYPMGKLMFVDQIQTTNMSKGGDSGSCLIEKETKKPVGLLFGGSNAASYCNPMKVVLSTLSMQHTYQYPSGATCHFNSDYPLRILQKRSYSTAAAPKFYRESAACVQSLRSLPARYRVAATVASVGFYVATMKLTDSAKPERKADGLLSRAITSCCFFRAAPVQSNASATHKPSIELRR